MTSNLGLSPAKLEFLRCIISKYWDFIYGDATGLAYLLDPSYCGAKLDITLQRDLETFLCDMTCQDESNLTPEDIEGIHSEIKDQLTEFMKRVQDVKTSDGSYVFDHPRAWWVRNGKHYPRLNYFAEQVFNFPPSTASTERSFSIQSFIKSKQRNRLDSERADKCLFVKTNLHLFPPRGLNSAGRLDFSSDEDSD